MRMPDGFTNQEWVSDALELELQVAVSHNMDTGTKPGPLQEQQNS